MALTKFVRNSSDLSDDGGYKFRFCCDQCGDGYDSQYEAASANLLKTAIDVFNIFRPGLGGFGRTADSIDRGLRGKERDAAYERAAQKAMLFFKKCTGCGKWVCPEACWNDPVGMCETCAPNAAEAGAKAAARRTAIAAEGKPAPKGTMSCPQCQASTSGGKFCGECGASLTASASCGGCGAELAPQAKFCAECGKKNTP